MTTPPTPPAQDRDAVELTRPLREPAAFVLLAANGLFLLLGIADLLIARDSWAGDFGGRSAATFPTFIGLYSTVLPLLAVLLATHLRPVAAHAKLITVAALAEYGVGAFFGGITYLAAFASDMSRTDGPSLGQQFENLVYRTIWVGLYALAAYVVFRVWQGRYAPARAPKAPPGYYGVPPQYAQPGYPAPNYAPGYAQPGGHPAPPSTGWPQVPPPPAPAHPYPQQPAAPQQPPAAPVSAQPVVDRPTEPAQPQGPVLPAGPTDRSEPADPTDRSEPADPTVTRNPANEG